MNEPHDAHDIDVAVLLLGIDAEARETVQQALRELAERGDTTSAVGLTRMLRQAIAVLRGADAAWTHAGAENHRPMRAADAEAAFGRATRRARERFEHELIRGSGGEVIRKPAPPLAERPGVRGIVVVTLVVAARVELVDLLEVRDREKVARVLDALGAIDPRDFVAMEVIWSPADPRERLASDELERRHPELVRLS